MIRKAMFKSVDFGQFKWSLLNWNHSKIWISIWLTELFVIDWTISSSMHLRCSMFGFLSEPDLCNFRFLMQAYALASGGCHQNWSLEATISPHRGQRASGSEDTGGSTVHLSTTRSPASEHHQDPVVDIQRSEFDIQYLVFDIQHFVSNIRQLIFQNSSCSTEKTIERHIHQRQDEVFRGQSN